MNELKPVQAVLLVAGRELNTKLRTRSFIISTVVSIVVLGVFVLLQSSAFNDGERSEVGLSGQATALGPQIVDSAKQLGYTVRIHDITEPATGEQQVRDGDLDALVTGPVGSLQVTVKDKLATELRNTLNGLMQQQILTSELAAADLDPKEVLSTASAAQVKVTELEPTGDDQGQRLAIGLIVAFLLYMALMIYGQMVAQGVVEEKSSRVVELLLATMRPWQLLAGKVLGLGVVGLIQFAAIALVGLIAGLATGAITISGAAIGGVFAGVLWYLLGFFFYATIFAALGSLVSRQEDAQSVITPVTMVIVIGFIFGINLLLSDASSGLTIFMAVLPPFAPILMPGLTALGLAPIWLQATAILLTLGGIALVAWIGGKIYQNAVLRTGSRVRLREALKLA
ncbi:ABC-2 type transport system permease protein [Kibdelosporangium banguiense]|uniref:ABC-2 type transport system permease protein n=1 Tax=Kibdelosporangium banguiense TaxID=1365924 RepID=A0ABS4TB47_9PSEU|nr:ABC transporter permease [Kibdelosporangium banguiense]MBP2321113.1 ABC-2 type transport system permease protein [Kibdelosporangium banguiense]